MEAILHAAQQRLRPILMTSLATSLGALPIALGLGASSTSRVPLGISVVGGIIFSLILTLFVIPAIYTYLSGKHKGTDKAYSTTPVLAEDVAKNDAGTKPDIG
jgi:multidrug efflux pump subunit AcrB